MIFGSLRAKIFLSIAAPTLFFAAATIAFTETVVRTRLLSFLQEKGVGVAKMVAADAVNPVITERYFEIAMLFKDLQSGDEGIVYAYIVSEEGRDLVSTFAGGVPEGLKRAHPVDPRLPSSARRLLTERGPVLDVGVPLLRGQIGVLHMGFSLAPLRENVNRFVLLVSLFAAGALTVGAAAAIAFSRVITRPLEKLAAAAESFGRGDAGEPLTIESDDEVGRLAVVFNEMVANRTRIATERERLIGELRKSIGEVKTLRGFLPICSSCKKIRGDEGYWEQIESYIRDHTDAEFSHGLCPDCTKTLYPEIWERMQNGGR